MAYQTGTFTGTYKSDIGSQPAEGHVEIFPVVDSTDKTKLAQILDGDGSVILTGRVKATLVDGAFSVTLPATDDTALNPTGFGYVAVAHLQHTRLPAVTFQLPGGTTVDVEDVTSVPEATFNAETTYVDQAALDATLAGYVGRADAPGGSDDTAMIQALLDAAESAGGGEVLLRAGTYLAAGLTISSGVTLAGAGMDATTIQAPAGANADVIQTQGFATLTGTNKWLISDGLVVGFTIRDLRIDGNRADNTSGRGIAIYGKRYVIDKVVITNTAGDGFYSEAGNTRGQPTTSDMPECDIKLLYVYKAGNVGFRFLGPHDGHVGTVWVAQSDDVGVRFDENDDAATGYLGTADVDFIHTYSNTGDGVVLTTGIRANHLISESNYGAGLIAGGTNTHISQLFLYLNYANYDTPAVMTAQANPHLHVVEQDLMVGVCKIEMQFGGTGVRADAPCNIDQLLIDGVSTGGIGVDVNSSEVIVGGAIRDLSDTGGIGFRHAPGTGVSYNRADLTISNCALGATNTGGGVLLDYTLRIRTDAASQVAHTLALSDEQNKVIVSVSGAGSGVGFTDIAPETLRNDLGLLTVGQSTIPRKLATTASPFTASGDMLLTFFTATRTETVTKLATTTFGTAAAATPTMIRFGIYEEDPDTGDLVTRLGSTTNDTSLFAATFTTYEKALFAPVTFTRGKRYAIGLLIVSSVALPNFYGLIEAATPAGYAPVEGRRVTGLADLPPSVTAASAPAYQRLIAVHALP